MKINEIEKLTKGLSWNNPKEVQLLSINQLQEINEEQTPLLLQDEGKDCWGNAVEVLRIIGYPRNRFAIPRLIWLLKDMNWPGVSTAIEILKTVDFNIIISHIEVALNEAYKEGDYMWIGGIKRIVQLMNITEQDFSNRQTYKLLELSDW